MSAMTMFNSFEPSLSSMNYPHTMSVPSTSPPPQTPSKQAPVTTATTAPATAPAKAGKAKKTNDKAERRAAKVAAKGTAPVVADTSVASPSSSPVAHLIKLPHGGDRPRRGTASAGTAAATHSNPPVAAMQGPLQMFAHLEVPVASHALASSSSKAATLHPAVLRLAQLYAEFKIVGANARCIAMLEAFKQVVRAYVTPPGNSLSRHLTTHLAAHIAHLIRARPLSTSMGNTIRYLKHEISTLGVDISDEDAKELLCARMDHFVRDRITAADKVITESALTKIHDGDTIMTYSRSSIVEQVFLEAKARKRRFSVIVVDSGPMYEGRHLLRVLSQAQIPCTYVLLSALGTVLPLTDMLLLGTNCLLSNGAMQARVGTACVAMMASRKGVPVVCCCETYKFSDQVKLDSIVSNEVGTIETRISPPSINPLFPLASYSPTTCLDSCTTLNQDGVDSSPTTTSSRDINPNSKLQEISLLYDVSRPEDVTLVISEAGMGPVKSVPFIMRDYKPLAGT